jgi:hypothetical protein
MPDELIIRLEGPESVSVEIENDMPEYDDELDDIRSLLGDICESMAENPAIKFVVTFKDELWPTDVETDLLTLLEQLPEVPNGFEKPFDIDFYEQGLERTLRFTPLGENLLVRCDSSHPTWKAPKHPVQILREDFRASVSELVRRFGDLATTIRPALVQHPWFIAWKTAVSAIFEP